MNSLLIATFDRETHARSAMKKMDDLARDGVIDLYERTMIRRTADGRCKVFKGDVSAGWKTLAGAGIGSVIGLLAGPIGSVTGLVAGTFIGSAISDREHHDFGDRVVKALRDRIRRGKVVIAAHVGERDPQVVDSVLKHFDADIFRTAPLAAE